MEQRYTTINPGNTVPMPANPPKNPSSSFASFLAEPVSFRIAFFRDLRGNMTELAETVPGASA
jgi:hypothetical protein